MMIIRVFVSLIFLIAHLSVSAQKDFSSLVNPFIGTGGHGHTYPGAAVPFGMMQLSPDTRMADWDGSSGYHYSDSVIYGFSHTHLSGTGIPDYCDLLLMPFIGEAQWDNKDYRSTFSHKNEKASPGYYEVLLDKHNIKAQLTTTTRAGMHQYTFPNPGGQGKVMIDLFHRDQMIDISLEKISQYELRGYRRSKSWAQDQVVYFHIKSEQPFYTERQFEDSAIRTALFFVVPRDGKARLKVGISGVSMEGAKLNLDTEMPGWNFDGVREEARKAWNKELSKIEIKGGTTDQQTIFYTALYHTFLSPNIYQDVDGRYRGTDKQIHRANDFTNYSVFSLWDTYRAFHPLMTILNRKRTGDWINTFLKQYQQGGMLPVWELSANETFCMIGYHSVPVIVDAFRKGIKNFDHSLALEAMRSYAESNRFGLMPYRENGYLSNDMEHESVSKTLEYAFDDWCIAQFARAIGVDSVYRQYTRRAQHYKNIFDPSTSHMRGKIQSMWHQPFDPKEINNFFTEGNSWQYSFAVQQDIKNMIRLYGGKEKFTAKLIELFTTGSATTGRDQADVTGLIGQYAHGNEPSHHMAYLFNYVGMPWRTQELIRRICKEFYTNAPDGLIGNEDCGQMSAWYIFSAMGFYPVNPANGEYVLGTPLFEEVKINLENGKTFLIKARRSTHGSKYVQSVSLNGKPHTKSFFRHDAIAKGGHILFVLGDQPNKQFGNLPGDQPNSSIDEELIVPVPFFKMSSNKFRSELEVVLDDLDTTADIYYRIVRPDIRSMFVKYEKPFLISGSCDIQAYAQKGGNKSSMINQHFHQLPHHYSIEVRSTVHPMYTAGGPEALIDGVMGTTNWRTGEWQSYFDQDFEAVIDMQKEQLVNYVGVHVLQDVSPWILYPKEVRFYISLDGVQFVEAGTAGRPSSLSEEPSERILGDTINKRARYVKIKAVNGGKLPAWHESAGNGSHLFIDEIIVK